MALPAIAGHSYPNELMLNFDHTLISLKIKGIIEFELFKYRNVLFISDQKIMIFD